jgi:hypothetical protein
MDRGQSVLIGKIADKWGISMDEAALNIRMRAMIKGKIAESGLEQPQLLEARNVAIANNMFWMLMDREVAEPDGINYQRVYDRWFEWFSSFSGRKYEHKEKPGERNTDDIEDLKCEDSKTRDKLTALSLDDLILDGPCDLITNEDYFTEGGQTV